MIAVGLRTSSSFLSWLFNACISICVSEPAFGTLLLSVLLPWKIMYMKLFWSSFHLNIVLCLCKTYFGCCELEGVRFIVFKRSSIDSYLKKQKIQLRCLKGYFCKDDSRNSMTLTTTDSTVAIIFVNIPCPATLTSWLGVADVSFVDWVLQALPPHEGLATAMFSVPSVVKRSFFITALFVFIRWLLFSSQRSPER